MLSPSHEGYTVPNVKGQFVSLNVMSASSGYETLGCPVDLLSHIDY